MLLFTYMKKIKHANPIFEIIGNHKYIVIALAIVAVGVYINSTDNPTRSATEYCSILENAAKNPNTSKADSIQILKNAEKVAPMEIEPDARKYRQILETIEKDPTQTIGASMNGLQYEERFKAWIQKNCKAN